MHFLICRITDGKLDYVSEHGLTPDQALAVHYNDQATAESARVKYFDDHCIFEDQRSAYAVIPVAGQVAPGTADNHKKFPGPGFFEVHYPRTADDVLNRIADQNFDSLFRATDKIDEAGCWSSSALLDPFSSVAVGALHVCP